MTWTGMWRNQYGSSLEIESEADHRVGRMETLWYVVTDSVPAGGAPGTLEKVKWWRAVMTGADTFERVS